MLFKSLFTRPAQLHRTIMATTAPNQINPDSLASFRAHLAQSTRIVALLGAGISASSGLPTFRGAGGLWRTHDATSLATPEAFLADPGFVWQFYNYRRHMALNAKPNRAHMALVELAKRNPDFITLSQNVDGLSPRAGHPRKQLKLLHGNVFDVKCWDQRRCRYVEQDNFTDPIVPALAIPAEQEKVEAALETGEYDGVDSSSRRSKPTRPNALIRGADISNIDVPLASVPPSELPQCPKCTKNLLRPGVVWFGESLPRDTLREVDEYFSAREKIDLMLVIGTSSKVYPAAGYTDVARRRGARVAVINMDAGDATGLTDKDWLFQGDAAVIVPELLKDLVGEVEEFKER